MTKDEDEAKVLAQVMSLFTHKHLKKIKNNRLREHMGDQKSINQILREYRDYISGADEAEQKFVFFGTSKFETILEIMEEQLRVVQHGKLLNYVDQDFGNLETLFDRVQNNNEDIKNKEINKILEGQITTGQEKTPITAHEEITDPANNISLSHLLKEYLEAKKDEIRPKTSNKIKAHFEAMIKCVGDLKIDQFKQNHFRDYQQQLSKKAIKSRGEIKPVSPITKNDHLASCRKVFDHAQAFYNKNLENYFDNPKIKYKVKKTDKRIRMNYTKQELTKIFSHKIFTEGKYFHPYQYWALLLALYTGSRANEIAQLRVLDIIIKNDIPCIDHNSSTADKNIKTGIGRLIPLHPKLIELGFLDFVELFKNTAYQWEENTENHRIFKGLNYDQTIGSYHRRLSDWFNRSIKNSAGTLTGFKHDVGIDIPENVMKDFHSFRHTLATELDEVGVLPNISYMITGHAIDSEIAKMKSSAGEEYRHGVSVKKIYKEICKLDFDDVLVNVKPFFEINGEKKCRNKPKKVTKK